eukprot:72699-Amorphochlora_amoeboformis.AAC.2
MGRCKRATQPVVLRAVLSVFLVLISVKELTRRTIEDSQSGKPMTNLPESLGLSGLSGMW